MRAGRRRPAGDDAQARLDRAVAVLRSCQAAGIVMVATQDVLGLLTASGTVSGPAPQPPPRDPRVDPVTGARWAGPPGTLPPGGGG